MAQKSREVGVELEGSWEEREEGVSRRKDWKLSRGPYQDGCERDGVDQGRTRADGGAALMIKFCRGTEECGDKLRDVITPGGKWM